MRTPAVLLLCALAVACTETTPTDPVEAPARPSFSTASTTIDFEDLTTGVCGTSITSYASLVLTPANFAWQFRDSRFCSFGLAPHGGHGVLFGNVFAPYQTLTLSAPVHTVSFWVMSQFTLPIDVLDTDGNVIQTTTVAAAPNTPSDPFGTSDHYLIVSLTGPGNAIKSIRFHIDDQLDPDAHTNFYLDDVILTAEGAAPVFTGFFQPIDNNGVLNLVKAGSAVPVKFTMGGDFGLGVIVKPPTAAAITCPTGVGADAVEETTTSPSGLTYNAATTQYTYVWKTQSAWKGTCKRLDMSLSDGVTHTALFQFK